VFYGCCDDNRNNINNVSNDAKIMEDLRVISIVLGSVGIFLTMLIVTSFFGILVSVIGFILALISLQEDNNILGLVLNSIAILLFMVMVSFAMCFIYYSASYVDSERAVNAAVAIGSIEYNDGMNMVEENAMLVSIR
jgi:hypothetical protein